MDVCLAVAHRPHHRHAAVIACRVYITVITLIERVVIFFPPPRKRLSCVYCSGCCRVRASRDNERKTIHSQTSTAMQAANCHQAHLRPAPLHARAMYVRTVHVPGHLGRFQLASTSLRKADPLINRLILFVYALPKLRVCAFWHKWQQKGTYLFLLGHVLPYRGMYVEDEIRTPSVTRESPKRRGTLALFGFIG